MKWSPYNQHTRLLSWLPWLTMVTFSRTCDILTNWVQQTAERHGCVTTGYACLVKLDSIDSLINLFQKIRFKFEFPSEQSGRPFFLLFNLGLEIRICDQHIAVHCDLDHSYFRAIRSSIFWPYNLGHGMCQGKSHLCHLSVGN